MVQSARVQQVVKGDDVVLTHQIMESVAFNAEIGRQPVLVNAGDVATFFYPLEDGSNDLIGYVGQPVGALPASKFTVAIPGDIPAVSPNPERGSKMFASGLGQTVRAEITRKIANPTGATTINTALISGVSDMTNIAIGQSVVGAGIPVGALVQAFDSVAQTVTLTVNATATAAGLSLVFGEKETHYLVNEVDIYERGFASSLDDTSGGLVPPAPSLNLT